MATGGLPVPSYNVSGTELTTMMRYLREYFNYYDFKNDTQKSAISKIMKRESDVFVSIPKGNGRSLCYQLPALVHSPKITLVFCPYESRIKEHIDRLTHLKIETKTVTNNLSVREQMAVFNYFFTNNASTYLLYVTLELATSNRFLIFLNNLILINKLAYIVVDESYFEIQWINTIKLEYQALGSIRQKYPEIPWIVTTSIIGSEVFEFIQKTLKLKTKDAGFVHFSSLYFKPNIYYDVVMDDIVGDSYNHLITFINECLKDNEDKSVSPLDSIGGLIYCKNKEKCKELAFELSNKGFSIASFHGFENDEQLGVYNAYMAGVYKILTVTSFSGMNIEKKKLSFVVHWGLPLSMLFYFHETSMAGKYSEFVRCRIYTTKKSAEYFNSENENFLKSAIDECDTLPKSLNAARAYLMFLQSLNMKNYCKSVMCRHGFISDYFGQRSPLCDDKCNICEEFTGHLLDESNPITDRDQIIEMEKRGRLTAKDKEHFRECCDNVLNWGMRITSGSYVNVFKDWYEQVTASIEKVNVGESPDETNEVDENNSTKANEDD